MQYIFFEIHTYTGLDSDIASIVHDDAPPSINNIIYLKDDFNISSATPTYTDPSGNDASVPTYFKVMDLSIHDETWVQSYNTKYGYLRFKMELPANPNYIEIDITDNRFKVVEKLRINVRG